MHVMFAFRTFRDQDGHFVNTLLRLTKNSLEASNHNYSTIDNSTLKHEEQTTSVKQLSTGERLKVFKIITVMTIIFSLKQYLLKDRCGVGEATE